MMFTSAQATEIAVTLLIVLIVGRRVVGMVQGTVLSVPRLFGFAAVFVALWGIVIFGSIPTPPWYSLLDDVVAVVATALIATPLVERRVVLEHRPNGDWVYKLPVVVPALYLGLFVIRVVVELFVVGTTPFGGASTVTLSPTQSGILQVVDVLFSISVGLLVARSWAVYRRFRKANSGSSGGPAPS